MSLNRHSSAAVGAVALAAALWSATPSAQAVRPPVPKDLAHQIACGPQAAFAPPVISVRVAGGQDRGKALFGTGDAVILTGGKAQGIKVGQEYFVRRIVADRFTDVLSGGVLPQSLHTAGWVRVVEVQPNASIAIISDACDGVIEGDYLDAYTPPAAAPTPGPMGDPDYAHPGRLVLGDERRQLGGPGALMVIDRGTDHGVHNGQRLTVFRETTGGTSAVFRVAEAWVVRVSAETSLIIVETSNDALYVGDRVAFHR